MRISWSSRGFLSAANIWKLHVRSYDRLGKLYRCEIDRTRAVDLVFVGGDGCVGGSGMPSLGQCPLMRNHPCLSDFLTNQVGMRSLVEE